MARLIVDSSPGQIATPDLSAEVEVRNAAAKSVWLPAAALGDEARLYFPTCSAGAPVTVRGLASAVASLAVALVGGDQVVSTAGTRRTYRRTAQGWEQVA